jgi:catechol 2,3-dioxygenase-like lactoylglutathione lyase family enzyme
MIALHHVHVVCSELPATESWFVDGLGAELVERRESRGLPTSELRLAGVRVLLRGRGSAELAAGRSYGIDHFALHVDNLDALVETLRTRGVEIARDPHDSPTNRVAFVRGPDDLVIELVQPR